ncbi:MAG: DMT family transporter [Pseudomonadota bacterium]
MTALTHDRPLVGVALMLGFCAVIPLSDALAKLLGDRIGLLQLVLIRFVAQAVLLVPAALVAGATLFPSPRAAWLTVLRTLLLIAGIATMFTALRVLPLADAVAIAFVLPFLMLLLGRVVLGEVVGPRRLLACAVGFLGTLMVIQPSFADVGWPTLLPLLVAVIFAAFTITTRTLSREMGPVAMQAASALLALPALAALATLPVPGEPAPTRLVWPEGVDLWLWLALGVSGALAHLMLTASLRFAPTTTIAPMHYLEIPFAVLLGWIFFADIPGPMAAAGIILTMAAGLYIVARERAVSRRRAAA